MYELAITTVTTPAASYALTDLPTVKEELGILPGDTANDSFLGRAITQASAAIATYCSRVFPVETVADRFYQRRSGTGFWRGDDDARLQLSRRPVTLISSIIETDFNQVQTTLVQDTDFKLDATRGIIERLDNDFLPRAWAASIIVATYSAGFATIPSDITEACLRLITARFRGKGRDPMLRGETDGQLGGQQYWVGPMPGQSGALPPEIQALVEPYKVPVIA